MTDRSPSPVAQLHAAPLKIVPSRTRALIASSVFAMVSTISASAHAQDAISEDAAVEQAVNQSPVLRGALIDIARADQNIEAADNLYVPVWQTDGGFTHAESPQVTPDGIYGKSESNTFNVGSEIRHTFPWGTNVQFRLEGLRTERTVEVTPGSEDRVTIGPSWGLTGRFAVVQPLMRGAGTDSGESELRQARLGHTSAERARDAQASQLLRDVLIAYWELWYQDRAARIERDAYDLAKRQQDEALERVEAGAIAPVETLTFETRVAELEQSVAQAQASVRVRSLELMRLIGYETFGKELRASDSAPDNAQGIPTQERALEMAMSQSVELAQIHAQIAQSRDRVASAGAASEPRFDLEAWAEASSLSTPDVPPAFSRFVAEPALSAHVGLVFELPLSGERHSAQVRAAQLDVDSDLAQLSTVRAQIGAQVSTQITQAQTAEHRFELAQKTADVAERQVTAQTERYENGVAIALEVQLAEDTRRRALLSVERARVDLAQALLNVQHLTGELLARYAQEVRNTPAIRNGIITRQTMIGASSALAGPF